MGWMRSRFDHLLGQHVVECSVKSCREFVSGAGPGGAHDAAIAANWVVRVGLGPTCPTHAPLSAIDSRVVRAVDVLRTMVRRGAFEADSVAHTMLREWEGR